MILVIDTCGAVGGVALVQVEADRAKVVGEAAIAGRTFASELVPAVSTLLEGAALHLPLLDAVAVVSGPGSFTGVRIGVSAAKGLVEAASIPLIAISRLEVLVRLAGFSERTIAVFDAGRGDFYAGIYEGGKCVREALMNLAQVEAVVAESPAKVVVCEARAESALAALHPVLLPAPMPADAMEIAVERWRSGHFEDVVALDGNYLRRSDAEIFLKSGPEASATDRKAGSLEHSGS
jgi:tRNA threonylcarbamoyladenosine biosynthesis protein TsaB